MRTVGSPWRALALLALAITCLATPFGRAAAQSDQATAERRIKAAFLVRFPEYVEWPATVFARPDSPITIGVVADAAMMAELRMVITSRSLNGRAFALRSVEEDDSTADLQIVYVGRGRHAALAPGQPVLVVRDVPGGLEHGSTVNFVVADGRVRFEVSLQDAEQRHLKLGSGLLTVAMNLRSGRP
jgi:hypothetical protein